MRARAVAVPPPNQVSTQASILRVLLVASCVVTQALRGQQIREAVSIDDLATRVRILLVSLSPNGTNVAYLTAQAIPRDDVYAIALYLLKTDGTGQPVLLDQYRLPADAVFDSDSGDVLTSAGQFFWSRDSKELAYSTHLGTGMTAKVRDLNTGRETVILGSFDRVELAPGNLHLQLVTTAHPEGAIAPRLQPEDLSLLVRDGYRFFGPLRNPKTQGKYVVQHWEYIWDATGAIKTNEADAISYAALPREWSGILPTSGVENRTENSETLRRPPIPSPDGSVAAVIEYSMRNLADPDKAYRASQILLEGLKNEHQHGRVLVPSEKPRASLRILGWNAGGNELYYASLNPRFSSLNAVSLNGRTKEIYKDESRFFFSSPSLEISDDRRVVVFVRSTNFVPDELVKVDLTAGVLTVLSSPNEEFKTKIPPVVRFLPIECCGADFYGRLYLPADYDGHKRYPLVFTNYVSDPGFDASVGDEVPVLALVARGIAVFAMNSREANIISGAGDFRFEISRVDKPLRAMEWVYHTLVAQGIVAPGKVGLTGLSYGTEIAMYAYWKSKILRAVSVATGSREPMDYVLGGIPFSRFLDSRGFKIPGAGSYSDWSELSAGLNARPDLPPLLVQSPDGEEYETVETWFRLRRVGAPVEWYEYPGEGHLKRSPANKWWVYTRNLDWFRFWLKDEEDPDPAKAEQYARWRELRKLGHAQ